jgi:ATP-dependent DNA helicase RecQ
LLAVQDIIALLNAQPMNRWVEIIAEGIAALARELGKGAMPPLDVIEWLAEWSRDTRGDQRGLLLLTGHRAKGLEFDHVVLLDGGWGAASRGEDDDAPRRLFYVGMTRAQRTLAVTTTGEHQFLNQKIDGVLHRRVNVDEDTGISTDKYYELPDLETVDLSFAGRLGQGHAAHKAIASTKVGEKIRLVQEGERWLVHDIHGHPLGRMASAWQPPVGFRFSKGTVGAIVRWRKLDNDERYRDRIKRDDWETILPEFEFTGDRS